MITLNDLIQRFGEQELIERSDRYHSESLNQIVIEVAIEDAVAEAQSYIRAAGIVLSKPSAALVGFVCDIARYRLYDDATNETIDERYKRAIAWLKEAVKNPSMLDDDVSGSLNAENRFVGCAVMPNQAPKWSDFAGD